ncbi:MAG: DUF3298 domain-containing protein [Prevotella sp.]|nr:DUF3298 domain-containing protein [Prevotella sp.]
MRNILFIVLAALIAASCGNKEEKTVTKAEGLDFDSITVDTIAALIQEEGSPSANIHVTMMYAQGDKGTAFNQTIRKGGFLTPDYMGMLSDRLTMKQAVDSFVISYVNDYKRDYAPLFRGDREHRDSYNLTYDCRTYVQNHRGGIVCYIARSTMYGGGEHSVTSTIAKNIEVKTGKVITAADVFAEGFEQPLADLIVKKLCKLQDVKTLKELQEKGFFVDIEPYASDNFILGDGEITFIYVDSEIAPHEAGEIRVTLNDDELESVVK